MIKMHLYFRLSLFGWPLKSHEEHYRFWCLGPTLKYSTLFGLGQALSLGIFESSSGDLTVPPRLAAMLSTLCSGSPLPLNEGLGKSLTSGNFQMVEPFAHFCIKHSLSSVIWLSNLIDTKHLNFSIYLISSLLIAHVAGGGRREAHGSSRPVLYPLCLILALECLEEGPWSLSSLNKEFSKETKIIK